MCTCISIFNNPKQIVGCAPSLNISQHKLLQKEYNKRKPKCCICMHSPKHNIRITPQAKHSLKFTMVMCCRAYVMPPAEHLVDKSCAISSISLFCNKALLGVILSGKSMQCVQILKCLRENYSGMDAMAAEAASTDASRGPPEPAAFSSDPEQIYWYIYA